MKEKNIIAIFDNTNQLQPTTKILDVLLMLMN